MGVDEECIDWANAVLREHPKKVVRVLIGAAALGLVLRHACAVDPYALDLPARVRLEEGLDRLELLAVGVRLWRGEWGERGERGERVSEVLGLASSGIIQRWEMARVSSMWVPLTTSA